MPRQKYDAIIEAVHYTPEGQIDLVRAYERRGAVWSDRLLIRRSELIERLKTGKRLVAGQRKVYWGGTFETGRQVTLAGKTILTEGHSGQKDNLTGVPVF